MYVNYLSSLRRCDNTEKLEAERKYQKGRIVTKVTNDIRPNETSDKLYGKIQAILVKYGIDTNKDITYKTFQIPKRTGGYRTICAPSDDLMRYQRNVLKAFYECKVLCDDSVHSFTKFRNCKTSLLRHQANHSRWFLKLDIHKYFDNVTTDKLADRLAEIHPFAEMVHNEPTAKNRLKRLLDKICMKDGVLPQGAATSPILSNLYLTGFDYKLRQELKNHGRFVFTRYADDILISSRESFSFAVIVNVVDDLLKDYGLELNKTKTRYGSCNGSNWNLGIMYNKDHNLTVGAHNKHVFKCRIHNLKSKNKDSVEYTEELFTLQGLLSYYISIEPEYFHKYKKILKELA